MNGPGQMTKTADMPINGIPFKHAFSSDDDLENLHGLFGAQYLQSIINDDLFYARSYVCPHTVIKRKS